MRRTSHVTERRARPLALVTLGIGLALLPACNDSGNTTITNQGLDCGLVRADLTGTWKVSFTPGARNLVNCDNPSFNTTSSGTGVDVTSTEKDYANNSVFGSEASASFLVQGDRTDAGGDAAVTPELTASVQADSCLALFRVWESDDTAFIQCLGTFDRNTRRIDNGSCDSAEIANSTGTTILATCDLSTPLSVVVAVP